MKGRRSVVSSRERATSPADEKSADSGVRRLGRWKARGTADTGIPCWIPPCWIPACPPRQPEGGGWRRGGHGARRLCGPAEPLTRRSRVRPSRSGRRGHSPQSNRASSRPARGACRVTRHYSLNSATLAGSVLDFLTQTCAPLPADSPHCNWTTSQPT